MQRIWVLAVSILVVLTGCVSGGEQLDPQSHEPANASEDPSSASQTRAAGDEASGDEASTQEPNGTQAADRSTTPQNGTSGTQAEPVAARPPDPNVTVAVVDTGINLYHEAFRADGDWEPPADATPVGLTLGKDYRSNVEADWDTLRRLESGQLYSFPGTKVAAAISFLEPLGCASPAEQVCQRSLPWPRMLDDPENGTPHGTWTASRVVGSNMGMGTSEDVRLVLVQVNLNGTSIARGFDWLEGQDWIDAVSVSLFARHGLADRDFLDTLHRISHAKPVFVSSGNGVGNVGLAPKPDWAQDGLPDTIAVGGVDNDRLTHWSDQDPYVAADACGTPLASPDATTGTDGVLGGTSFSAPYVAGAGAELILEARELLGDARRGPATNASLAPPSEAWSSGRADDARTVLAEGPEGSLTSGPLVDGIFTLRELKDVLYHTAEPTPSTHPHDGILCRTSQVPADPVPEQARSTYVGYGEVTPASLDAASAVLHGHAKIPDRSTADTHYERAYALRGLTTQQQLPSAP